MAKIKQSGTYTMKTYRKPNGQLFSQEVATQLPKLNLTYENILKAPTALKKFNTKTYNERITTEVSPWNDHIKFLAG